MKIIKYLHKNEISYGILEGEIICNLKGDIFSDFSIGKRVTKLDKIDLLFPVEPPNIIAIGLNYKKYAEESLNYVLGYTCANDVSAREKPVFLEDRDEIEIKIDGIGSLKNKVKLND